VDRALGDQFTEPHAFSGSLPHCCCFVTMLLLFVFHIAENELIKMMMMIILVCSTCGADQLHCGTLLRVTF